MANYKYDYKKLKFLLKQYLIDYHYVDPTKNFHCLSPNHTDEHPSMNYSEKYNMCRCFACGKKYDIFSLVAQDFNINSSNFKSQIDKVVELYPNFVEVEKDWQEKHLKSYDKSESKADYTNYYRICQLNLFKTNYLRNRGLSNKLLMNYGVGYDSKQDMVIFPIAKNCYFSRSTKENIKKNSAGAIHLWNENIIPQAKDLVVTEGIIDALSLKEAGLALDVCALNGVGNYPKLLKILKENPLDNRRIIIALDNDNVGQNYAKMLSEELKKINILANIYPFTHSYKDCNEALLNDKASFISSIKFLESALNQVHKTQDIKESEMEL